MNPRVYQTHAEFLDANPDLVARYEVVRAEEAAHEAAVTAKDEAAKKAAAKLKKE